MTLIDSKTLPDVQHQSDHRRIPIDQVGITDLHYPIVVLDQSQQRQHVTATLSMSVSLPHHFKGTHMSRFVEVLAAHEGEVTMRTLPTILKELRNRLNAASAQIEVSFKYFLERIAPVSRSRALMDYQCLFTGESNDVADDFVLAVEVPVTSLCPCSKAISDYGAHNQRGFVTMAVRTVENGKMVWIEELIEIAEKAASSPVFPLLKRPDERFVTMHAYENPVFVEDLARNVAASLQRDDRIASFVVKVVNQESIHNHNAFAKIEWKR